MDLTNEEARQLAEDLIAEADAILCSPGAHADTAAKLQSRWEAITGGEDEREIAARRRAAEMLKRADEALLQPRPDPDESERRWREAEAGRRASAEHRAWLASIEHSRAPAPQHAPVSQPAPPSPSMPSQAPVVYLTLLEANRRHEVFEEVLSEVIRRERAAWQERVARQEIRFNALTQGARSNADE